VIPAPFEYEVADSVEHALELLGRYGDEAKPLAGGQSLLSFMKLRLGRPSALVDIGRIAGLAYVREEGDRVAIGALTTYEDAHRDELLVRECPLLAHACGEVGDPQVRHVGTVGGGVAHGDPASDVPAVLVALDGEVVLRGPDGGRTVAARDFCRSPFDVDLGPQELVTELRVPRTGGAGWSYVKLHPRAQDWAIVGAAALVRDGTAAVGLTNMGPRPLRATAVEEALAAGEPPESAARAAAEGTDPVDDVFASAEYRRHLAPIAVRRALEEALAR
jgi:aerobic carbon-monoxide dehydrogenase medium subunit